MTMSESEKLLSCIINIWQDAYTAYKEPGKRQDQRARAALKILGFTAGNRTADINKGRLMHEYLALITGSPDLNDMTSWKNPPTPLSKKAAVDALAKKHDMTSAAIGKHLRDFQTIQSRKCNADGLPSHGWHDLLPPHK